MRTLIGALIGATLATITAVILDVATTGRIFR